MVVENPIIHSIFSKNKNFAQTVTDFFDILVTLTEGINMKNGQMTPFFSSTL